MFPHLARRQARTLLWGAVALLAGSVLASTGPVGGALASDPDSPVTWSVQPSSSTGPDGRPWIEQTLDPGESAMEHLAVRNFSDHAVNFRLVAADGFFNKNGHFNILPSDQTSTAAGTWIDISDSVDVPAGATVVVPLTIRVPETAQPGDHAAGVAASIMSTSTAQDGSDVGVESRVGCRIMIRVTGELAPGASIDNVTTTYQTSWNPFVPGDLTVEFDVTNTGNTRLRLTGVTTAAGSETRFPPSDQPQELLVGEARRMSVAISDVWATVLVPLSITVDPEVVVVGSDSPPGLAAVEVETTVVAMPWPQLALLIGVALIAVAILWRKGRSKRHLERLLHDAHEEGRRSVLTEQDRP